MNGNGPVQIGRFERRFVYRLGPATDQRQSVEPGQVGVTEYAEYCRPTACVRQKWRGLKPIMPAIEFLEKCSLALNLHRFVGGKSQCLGVCTTAAPPAVCALLEQGFNCAQ